ncbi:tannase/feruloyl esterase family alpha/beta hydrolase [Variovorax paradoxus]|uniref:Tannase and feruloyl esterase n=1 Tax=Variovorax paradoxus TaxID=34073 RepID=A0A0H2LYQ8_VARPD|nr:tannase/feruloyl esterase family alpha/beta hydrolase [Variovorax paradoxus]KLN53592.1 tannase and feruloyl esterase [Variovorax paradoxus]
MAVKRSGASRAATCCCIAAFLTACGGSGGTRGFPTVGIPPVTGAPPLQKLACDDSMKSRFAPDAATAVLMVKAFKKGDALLLTGTASPSTPVAQNDLCFVKLNVGPGNPGVADASSTSAGIGIEIWLPTAANWNKRIHVKGGGGWAGGTQGTLTGITPNSGSAGSASETAGVEGAVSATTDTGHAVSNGSFAMNPDGTVNTVLWKDFSGRGIHEMAVKTKALAKAYYGEDAKYAYWNGFSTGGRQGLKEAQANPADFDGILAGAPANNWTKFITTELYPQIVVQRDLAGVSITAAQHTSVSNAAINACDVVGGVHLGYVPDPAACRYDPTTDAAVICSADGGTNATAGCVTPAQALAFNKFWYGQTANGAVPNPAADNGFAAATAASQKWYGLARGSSLMGLAGATPFPISSDMVALELQDPTIATPSFLNATGNGADGWKSLTYPQLANAWDRGVALQTAFANINTDSADLSAFRDRKGKLISYHGLADTLIPPQGTINYYSRVATQMGGVAATQGFYRLYLVPGMGHGFSNGTSNASANPPLPTNAQLYELLTAWVERGIEPPVRVEATTLASASFPVVKSRPLCLYPLKANYTSGDPNLAASYTCS